MDPHDEWAEFDRVEAEIEGAAARRDWEAAAAQIAEEEKAEITIRALGALWNFEVQFLVLAKHAAGNLSTGTGIVWKAFDEDADEDEPLPRTFSISMEAAQQLMDDLWSFNIRPTPNPAPSGPLGSN